MFKSLILIKILNRIIHKIIIKTNIEFIHVVLEVILGEIIIHNKSTLKILLNY